MLILLIYFANIPSANCYDLEDSKQLPILIWDGMYRGLWHWIYHMTVTMPQPLPSQALRKASGSERVSNPKAPTCRDPKLFLISIIFQENNTTIIKSQVKHQTSTVESTVSQMFLSWNLQNLRRFHINIIKQTYILWIPCPYPYPNAPCILYLPTNLGDLWGKCW